MIFAFATVTFYTSCTDACKDVDCNDAKGGVCVDGTCDCSSATGYEGTDCKTEVRAKFIAGYTVVDGCSASGAATYTINITISSSDVTKVLLSNFWGVFTNSVVATVNGNSLTIASQQPDLDGYIVSGNGTISGSTLSLNYTVIDPGGNTDVCSANCTKQ